MQTKQNDQPRDQKPKQVVAPMAVVVMVQPAQLVEEAVEDRHQMTLLALGQ
jgi:hypothetical protein